MDITRIISSGLGSDSSLHRNGKQKGQQQPADGKTKGGTEGGLSFGVRHESESETEGIGKTMKRMASTPSALLAAALIAGASLPSLASGLDLSRLIERHYKRETSLGE